MPLKNTKHEIFAQEVAKGNSAQDAYLKAYPTSSKEAARKNASRLMANDGVLRRIDDIKSKVAQKCGITIENITEKLLQIAREAHSIGTAQALNVSRNSYMDAAKLNGLIIEKTENQSTVIIDISSEPLSEDEFESEYTD